MAKEESDNPFARMGFPMFGEKKEKGLFQKMKGKMKMATRKFNPATDRTRKFTYAFEEVQEDAEGIGTYFEVPQGASAGDDIVVDLPDGQQTVVRIPHGVEAGDLLEVLTEDLTMQLVRNKGKTSAYLKPLRVMIFAAGCCSAVLTLLAIITPYWVRVPAHHDVDCIGLGGRHFAGYNEQWNHIESWCTRDAMAQRSVSNPDVFARCQMYKNLQPVGLFTLMSLSILLLVQMMATLGLFFRRELCAVMSLAISLLGQSAIVANFMRKAYLVVVESYGSWVASWGLSAYVCIFGIVFGFLVWLAILVIYLDGQKSKKVLGRDLQGLQGLLLHTDAKDEEFEWDETDIYAGCPLVPCFYGLTPAGLYHHYRNYWWGSIYATLLYILSIIPHFIKTFDWNGIRRVYYGPPSEEQPLRERGVKSTVVINYMLYRRSNIIMCVIFVLPLIYLGFRNLLDQQAAMLDHVQAAEMANTFEEFVEQQALIGHTATFMDYTSYTIDKGLGSIGIWSDRLWVWRHIARLLLLVLALIFSFTAMLRWDDFKVSRYLLAHAWLAILIAPFAASLIPSRSFVDWRMFDDIVKNHVQEARTHYHVDGFIASCMYAEPSETLALASGYIKTTCDTIQDYVPFVMPSHIPIEVRGVSIPIPVHSLPWVGAALPLAGTDLKGVHSTCSELQSLAASNLTKDTTAFVEQACKQVGTLLYANLPEKDMTQLKAYKQRMSKVRAFDPSHLRGDHVIRLWHPHKAPIVQPVIGLSQVWQEEDLTGAIVRPVTNQDGCLPFPKSDLEVLNGKVFLLGPLETPNDDNNGFGPCNLARMMRHAKDAGASGVIFFGEEGNVKRDTRYVQPSTPFVFLSSPLDGGVLVQEVSGAAQTGGIHVSVEPSQVEWNEKNRRTAHGCRCAARGFDSECKVRDPGLFSKGRKLGEQEAYPWCETGQPCTDDKGKELIVDTCVPDGQASALQHPSKKCHPKFPCRRYHAFTHSLKNKFIVHKQYSRYDQCATSYEARNDWITGDRITWMDCVPPLGLNGVVTKVGDQESSLEGSQVSFIAGMRSVQMHGAVVTEPGCSYRLRVEDSVNSHVRFKFGDEELNALQETHADEEFEADVLIDVRSEAADKPLGAVVFEQRCQQGTQTENQELHGARRKVFEPAQESSGSYWTAVPLKSLRYFPKINEQVSGSFGMAADVLLQEGQAVKAGVNKTGATAARLADVVAHRSAQETEDLETMTIEKSLLESLPARSRLLHARAPRQISSSLISKSNLSDPTKLSEGDHDQLWTCATFTGGKCNNQNRCGENEVCDSQGAEDKPGGFCRCVSGTCISKQVGGCVPEAVHAKEVVQHLMSTSSFDKPIEKTIGSLKLGASVAISMKEGLANLNAIIGHILAIGPGILISVWTAKLIFAHSSIPAYFCYFFPWIYSPMAWALYNIYYQMLPDLRLFIGLAILAFWPIIMAMLSLSYGLHRQMKIPRLMGVINNLLVVYYLLLGAGYGFLIWFAFSFSPQGNDYISEKLRGDWAIKNWVYYYIESANLNFVLLWLIDSFAMFFFTCCAVTDGFIIMISQEHNEAWLMHHQGKKAVHAGQPQLSASAAAGMDAPTQKSFKEEGGLEEAIRKYSDAEYGTHSSEGRIDYDDDARFVIEEQVIKDWLLLIHDVRVKIPQRPGAEDSYNKDAPEWPEHWSSSAPVSVSGVSESFDTLAGTSMQDLSTGRGSAV